MNNNIREAVAKAFQSELGQQVNSIFTTSDERMFIRRDEAMSHADGALDPDTEPLADKTVLEWYEEYGGNSEPSVVYVVAFQDDNRMTTEQFTEFIGETIPSALFHVEPTDLNEDGLRLDEIILLDMLHENKSALKHKPLAWFVETFLK